VTLLSPLNEDERATFLVVSLPQKDLLKIVGRLGTAPKGTRIDRMSIWDLAWSLVDYYETDPEVNAAVDHALKRELGESPLAAAVSADGGAIAVTDLVLRSRDPARELAWALLTLAGDGAGPLAAELVGTIIADYDEADEAAKAEAEAEERKRAESADGEGPSPEELARIEAAAQLEEIQKEVARARGDQERARKRAESSRERVVELEQGLAAARRELRGSEAARRDVEAERDRLNEERSELRQQVKSGTAAEVARLVEELESAGRRERALAEEIAERRDAESELAARVRALEADLSARPAGETAGAGPPLEAGPGWSVPIFTEEFYDSLKAWDRKIVRITFEKVYRLAEDWRHPSLRAIPLEGIPGYFRIRIASDVRLIYRPAEGGRVEILSLIDREDLQRYIRQAKTR
jgi:hypothetical protein